MSYLVVKHVLVVNVRHASRLGVVDLPQQHSGHRGKVPSLPKEKSLVHVKVAKANIEGGGAPSLSDYLVRVLGEYRLASGDQHIPTRHEVRQNGWVNSLLAVQQFYWPFFFSVQDRRCLFRGSHS